MLNRKGRARLLACGSCGELARCERCTSATVQLDTELSCRACGLTRPLVCAACGSARLKALKLGVSRAGDELAGLTGRTVGEVTAESDGVPDVDILIGTEAVLHRVVDADLVAFLDFDQELLAPRFRAGDQALALLARAGRLVGGRASGRRVLVQTRLPRHEVLVAALHGEPARFTAAEDARRHELGFPPHGTLASISGPAAVDLVERVRAGTPAIAILGPDEGRWLLRADDAESLADALKAAGRPPGRLRVEVDPLRV